MEVPQRCLFSTPRPKLAAKRSLFGRITDEQRAQNRALIQNFSQTLEQASVQRYNFDFAKGEPLAGENQWEVAQDVPEVYKRMCSETERACSTPPSRRRLLGSVDHNCRAVPRVYAVPKSLPSSSVSVPPRTTGAISVSESTENRPVAAEQPSTTSPSVQKTQEASPSSSSSSRGSKRKQPKITECFAATKKNTKRKLDFGDA